MKKPSVAMFLVPAHSILSMRLVGLARPSHIQNSDKTLDIERFASEPLELVELKVGNQPVKDKITIKSRRNDEGLDTVTFKAEPGWFRHLEVRLRNISGSPIYGVRANLFFRPSPAKTLYSLPLAGSTQLQQGVLDPGAELTLLSNRRGMEFTRTYFQTLGQCY